MRRTAWGFLKGAETNLSGYHLALGDRSFELKQMTVEIVLSVVVAVAWKAHERPTRAQERSKRAPIVPKGAQSEH